jgi:TonB-linked SusC/RagA family outer membrane protein
MTIPLQKHDLQLSGGTDKMKYFAGVGYFGQDGLFEKVNYKRFNFNLNLESKVTKTTTVTLSVLGAIERTNDLDVASSATQLFRSGYKFLPTEAIYYSNGLWGQFAGNSPVAVLKGDGYNHTDGTTLLNTITLEQQLPFIKGLSVKGAFSYDTRMSFQKGWHTPFYYYAINLNVTPYTYTQQISTQEGGVPAYTYLTQQDNRNRNYTYQGYINYQRTFGKNEITGLLVAEARSNTSDYLFARRNNFAIGIDEMNLGSSSKTDYDNGGSSSEGTQIGYVYRLGYVYNNRYMLEATGRYDGHYYFAPDKKWGFFPAFSAGWRISEENFMQGIDWIDNLKLRGSWGKAGNLAGSAYQYLSGYTLAGNGYAYGTGSMVQRAYVTRENNPNITWEVSKKTDIGFEAALWKNLLTIEADWFSERRSGMLLSPAVTVPYEYGLTLADENSGEMKSSGFELTIGSRKDFQNGLRLGISGNMSIAENKMVQVFETKATFDNPNRRRTGRPYLTQFGYKSLGLFSTAEDTNGDNIINSSDGYNVTQFGTLRPGDIKYADLSGPNGDMVPDGKIDGNDEVRIGYSDRYPLMTFGLNANAGWKGFDLNLFFQGAGMTSFNIYTFQTYPFFNNNSNLDYEYYNNRWTPDNQNAKYTRATSAPTANNTAASDFWMRNTTYLRLKNASFGYTIPTRISQAIKIRSIRLYIGGENLLTFSNLKFMDPEMGYTNRETAYPNMKSYTFGANVTF